MSKIQGIYAASMSVINKNLTLNVKETINHAEMVIDQGCHGVAVFGSTGQAQLIPVAEKINLLNSLSSNKYKEKFVIGTGLNSLGETINFMEVANSLSFKNLAPLYTIKNTLIQTVDPNKKGKAYLLRVNEFSDRRTLSLKI